MAAGPRVGLDKSLQRHGERRLQEQLADLGHAAAGIEDLGPARRVEVELRAALGDGQHAVHVLVHREAAARVVDGRREHLGERPRPPGLEQRQVGVDSARHGERQVGVRTRAGRNALEAPPLEEGHRRQLRRDALAADRDRLSRASVVHERDALAAQRVGRGRLHDGRGEAGRHRRVDGVAAGQEHAHAGDGHQWVSGDDDALRPRDDGPRRRPVGRVMLDLVNAWKLIGHGGPRLPRQSWHSHTACVKALRCTLGFMVTLDAKDAILRLTAAAVPLSFRRQRRRHPVYAATRARTRPSREIVSQCEALASPRGHQYLCTAFNELRRPSCGLRC